MAKESWIHKVNLTYLNRFHILLIYFYTLSLIKIIEKCFIEIIYQLKILWALHVYKDIETCENLEDLFDSPFLQPFCLHCLIAMMAASKSLYLVIQDSYEPEWVDLHTVDSAIRVSDFICKYRHV